MRFPLDEILDSLQEDSCFSELQHHSSLMESYGNPPQGFNPTNFSVLACNLWPEGSYSELCVLV